MEPRAHISVLSGNVDLGTEITENVVLDVFHGFKSANAKHMVALDFIAQTHDGKLFACPVMLYVGTIGKDISKVGMAALGVPLGSAIELNEMLDGYASSDDIDTRLPEAMIISEASLKSTHCGAENFKLFLDTNHQEISLSRWDEVVLSSVRDEIFKFCKKPVLNEANTLIMSANGKTTVPFGQLLCGKSGTLWFD